jgi:Uma2 family endonuclease
MVLELIRGKVFKQAAEAPKMNHQRISIKLISALFEVLRSTKGKVFSAPLDVRLPVKSKKNANIDTVVQPDSCLVSDPSKRDEHGCMGAPDLVVEILSPGNNTKDLLHKYEVYEASGVLAYWVIHPNECTLIIYTLVEGKYQASRIFTFGHILSSRAWKALASIVMSFSKA